MTLSVQQESRGEALSKTQARKDSLPQLPNLNSRTRASQYPHFVPFPELSKLKSSDQSESQALSFTLSVGDIFFAGDMLPSVERGRRDCFEGDDVDEAMALSARYSSSQHCRKERRETIMDPRGNLFVLLWGRHARSVGSADLRTLLHWFETLILAVRLVQRP